MQKTTWIKESEAAELIGLAPSYLRKSVKNGRYQIPYTTRPSGRGFKYCKTTIEKILNENASIIPVIN